MNKVEIIPLSEITKEVYGDLARPSVEIIGKTAGRATNVALIPIRALLSVAESLEKAVNTKLASVAKSDLQSPDRRIALTSVNALLYAADDPQLRDMFANLIANSMLKEAQVNSHPAFVSIINELSSDDAKLIKFLARHYRGSMRLIDILAENKQGKKRLINPAAALIDDKMQDVSVVRNIELVTDNLHRLGILENSKPQQLKGDDEMKMGKPTADLLEAQQQILIAKEEKIVWYERRVRLTDLGLQFAVAAVCPPGYCIGICKGCGQKVVNKLDTSGTVVFSVAE
jgi:hypothetical protein